MSTISQRSIRERRVAGKAGKLALISHKRNRIAVGTNADPQQRENKTLTINTYTDGADYVVTLEGHAVSYTATTADADQAGVAAALAEEINGDEQVRGFLKATATGAVITLEALLPGLEIDASESDSKMTLADGDDAQSADEIPFGRVCVHGSESALDAPDKNSLVKLPSASDISGPVHVLAPTAANTTTYDLTIHGENGAMYTASFTSDLDATVQEIVEGQKAAIDALAITGLTTSEDDAALTVNLPLGHTMQYDASQYSSASHTPEKGLDSIFAGISIFTHDEEGDAYPANSTLMMLESDGDIYVENSDGVARGDQVHVELADGPNKGKMYNSASASRAPLAKAKFQEDSGDSLAIVRLT